jgi:hypothetical protein
MLEALNARRQRHMCFMYVRIGLRHGFDLHGCGRGLHQSIAPTVVLPSVTDVRQDNSSKRHRQRARRTAYPRWYHVAWPSVLQQTSFRP